MNNGIKQLVILSGKGGTGKTCVTAALAHLASANNPPVSIVLADADVDAANLELLLRPRVLESQDFQGGQAARINEDDCLGCGDCAAVCRFKALKINNSTYRVDPIACDGCAACVFQCPEEAIVMREQIVGQWFRSDSRYGPLFHAALHPAQDNSGKLVTLVKQQARLLAQDTGAALVVVDGPPGIGCPVISASTGMDLALHVVEPTISGVHDLERIMATTDHFGVPSLVLINKADLNPARADEITAFCAGRGVNVVGRIPYDTVVTEAMVRGLPVTDYTDGLVTEALMEVWERVKDRLLT